MTTHTATNAELTIQTQEQEMLKALDKLKAVITDHIVIIRFQIEYEPFSQFTTCFYYAGLDDVPGIGLGKTPMKAVKQLFRNLGITRVEQYIRRKEAANV